MNLSPSTPAESDRPSATPARPLGRPEGATHEAPRSAVGSRPDVRGSVPRRLALPALVLVVAVLLVASLMVGGYDITFANLFTADAWNMFLISRVPRTLALVFAGVAMSVSGVIMQVLTQNRFVEPTTIGTSQWAGLGILVMLVAVPGASMMLRMGVATLFAFVGTLAFMAIVRRVSLQSSIVVPLIGIMLGAVVSAVTVYLAATFDLLQAMDTWRSGGFSSIVRGAYEPLWIVAGTTVATFFLADRLTVAGLGRDLATNVGLRYERVVLLGTLVVAVATGVTSVVVGFLPFLGLIVPNMVSMVRGDDVRRNLPWVALVSVALILVCDLIGRVVIAPLELPVSVVLGTVGAVGFIVLVLRQRRHVTY
ncbi:ABC transporter permease [Oerskovia sp. NPDC060338]|uniref:ABC transporter permease n=1 Tax=Oerskovia sp. NPDC060338 TaxID=3347100 RepID=UPI00364936B9